MEQQTASELAREIAAHIMDDATIFLWVITLAVTTVAGVAVPMFYKLMHVLGIVQKTRDEDLPKVQEVVDDTNQMHKNPGKYRFGSEVVERKVDELRADNERCFSALIEGQKEQTNVARKLVETMIEMSSATKAMNTTTQTVIQMVTERRTEPR